jgi:hypothetical protein
VEVNAVQQRPRDARCVALDLLRRTQAGALRVRKIATGTPVQRSALSFPITLALGRRIAAAHTLVA